MVSEKLREIIADKLGISIDEVTPNATFREDLGTDSLDLFDIVMALEDEFGVSIPNEDVESIQTVEDAVKYIESKKQ